MWLPGTVLLLYQKQVLKVFFYKHGENYKDIGICLRHKGYGLERMLPKILSNILQSRSNASKTNISDIDV